MGWCKEINIQVSGLVQHLLHRLELVPHNLPSTIKGPHLPSTSAVSHEQQKEDMGVGEQYTESCQWQNMTLPLQSTVLIHQNKQLEGTLCHSLLPFTGPHSANVPCLMVSCAAQSSPGWLAPHCKHTDYSLSMFPKECDVVTIYITFTFKSSPDDLKYVKGICKCFGFQIRQIWVSMEDLEPILREYCGITIVGFCAPLLGTHSQSKTFLISPLISSYQGARCLDQAPEPAVYHILMICGE